MATHEQFDTYAGIHFRDITKSDPNTYGNNTLRLELARAGVGTLVIPNVKAYNFEQGTVLAHPTEGDDHMTLATSREFPMSSGGLDVVRARVLTPAGLEDRLPVLNGPRLRSIGASKAEQYEIASDFMPRTVVIEQNQVFNTTLIESLVGDRLVVKADMSQDSQHITMCARSEVGIALSAMRADFAQSEQASAKPRSNSRILVQEFAPGQSWFGVRGIDAQSILALQNADTTEIRMYCYVDQAKEITLSDRHYATARAFKDGKDDWVSIDQASVPETAWKIADTVSDRLLERAGVKAGYFAIDLIQSTLPGETDTRILIREINTRDPMMVEMSNVHDGLLQRRLLANAMATIAKRG
jgi:hypothetical protein